MTELDGLGVRMKVQMNRLRPHYKEDVTRKEAATLSQSIDNPWSFWLHCPFSLESEAVVADPAPSRRRNLLR